MNKQSNMETLFHKYLENTINLAEMEEVYHYFEGEKNPVLLRTLICEKMNLVEDRATYEELALAKKIEAAAWPNIQMHIHQSSPPIKRLNKPNFKRYLLYAASVILVLVGLFSVYYTKNSTGEGVLVSKYGEDVLPNDNRATIILSDGQQIELKASKQGIQIDDHGIYYEDGSPLISNASVFATIRTSIGGQYRVTLPDGTKVILNTATSLQYPTQFTGNERRVKLEGEAYFEVTKNVNKPFRVESNTQVLEVLGTSFNLSSYANNPIITTLIEGCVHLNDNGATTLLYADQQAVKRDDKYFIQKIEAGDYTAWIHNQFIFNNSSLTETFAQLERWYDVTFEYPNGVTGERIYAEIGRDRKLSEVIEVLEEVVNLKFTIKGRRVIVRK